MADAVAAVTIEISELHVTVPRTARYYMIGAPSGHVRDVWIVCHGYAQLAAQFAEPFRALADEARIVVVPEALSRFYVAASDAGYHGAAVPVAASWMTREDRDVEIDDIVTYLDTLAERVVELLATHGVSRSEIRLNVLGFSQGAAAASRWAARGAIAVDRLVVWGSGIPSDVNIRAMAERRSGFRVDVVYGLRDKLLAGPAIEAQRAMLEAAGVLYRVRTFDGGHVLNRVLLREIAGGAGAG